MLDFTNKSVLVVAPHLDDVELGMGGTLNKISRSNPKSINYIGLSFPPNVDHESYMKEFWESNREFNIPKENYTFRSYDPRDLFTSRLDILQLMYDLNKEISPDIVFIPNSQDVHQSHQAVHQEGVRVFKNSTILGYELPWNSIRMNMDVFISLDEEDVLVKQRAINSFGSQFSRTFFENNILSSLAEVRGKQVNKKYAECFELIRMVC
tara:strand:+ start:24312 stop:24938 length:627 start_codon:yes stop_codon:yes gene_type:complete